MRFIAGYLALYGIVLALLFHYEHFQIVEPLAVLAIFGGVFSSVAWLLTRTATKVDAAEPRRGVLWYLLVIAAFATWGLSAMPTAEPLRDLVVMIAKLAVIVAIPWLLFDRTALPLRFNRSDAVTTVVMAAMMLTFQYFFGRGPRDIAAAHFSPHHLAIGIAFAFVWLCIEAGLVEEYFFRRLLQSRLESLMRSSAGAIVVASLLFGLVHAPGLYLRTARTGEGLGNAPSLLMAIGYAVVILSPTGFFFGILWSRTRNLAIVILVHAAGDLLPGVVGLTKHFF